jgi:uncharacterized protein
MPTTAQPTGFSSLEGKPYLSITTFRRDGTEASTPVWFVSDDLRRRLFVATGAKTWKMRRIRRDPHVRVAACTSRGKVKGEPIDGVARVVDEEPLVRRLQSEKYGWQKWLVESAYGLGRAVTRKPAEESVFLEITPLVEAGAATHSRAA